MAIYRFLPSLFCNVQQRLQRLARDPSTFCCYLVRWRIIILSSVMCSNADFPWFSADIYHVSTKKFIAIFAMFVGCPCRDWAHGQHERQGWQGKLRQQRSVDAPWCWRDRLRSLDVSHLECLFIFNNIINCTVTCTCLQHYCQNLISLHFVYVYNTNSHVQRDHVVWWSFLGWQF